MSSASALRDESERDYEPWLFQTMIAELESNELGVGFIYTLLERVAQRHGLVDAVVVLNHEAIGTQSFRLGQRPVGLSNLPDSGSEPGLYCEPDVVPQDERDAVRTACQLALSLHVARFSSEHDPLTNICNRRSFDSALQTAASRRARYGWAFSLVIIDLNDFKSVNDRAGHDFGDYVLRQFGFALRQAIRHGDVAARLGGDEFAVILSNAEGPEAVGFIDRLRTHLKTTGDLVEFTFGTATSPRDSTDPGELVRIADARLYERKGIRLS